MSGGAQYAVITRSQLDSIRARVAEQQPDSKREELLRLKQLSDERAESWPNTLQAQRARKERARTERAAAEESERIEADRQEAEHRSEQRRVQIERANKILFDETDRVKALHGKMLHSDAIKENEVLMQLKKQIQVLERAQEAAFVEQQRQALEIADAAELARFEAMRQRAMQQRAVQLQQLEELKAKILAERADNRLEGQLVKQRALQEAEEMRQKDLARLARAKQLNEESKEANRTLQAMKLKEKEVIKKQDEAIHEYSRRKAELQAEREQREREKRERKELDKKAIADLMERSYISTQQKEEERLTRDVQAADDKAAARESARRQKQLDTLAAMDRSNKLQLAQRADARARTAAEEAEFKIAWDARVKELKQEEEAEVAARRQEARRLQSFQVHQVEVKGRRKATQQLQDLQDAAQIQLALQEQDEQFKQYADLCVSEYAAQGKTTVPMELLLNKRPTLDLRR